VSSWNCRAVKNCLILEPISKHPLLPDICVPDELDLRFALTDSNFDTLVELQRYPRNTQCILPVNPPQADRLPPLKVRDLRFDLEQISADFEIEHFETASVVFSFLIMKFVLFIEKHYRYEARR